MSQYSSVRKLIAGLGLAILGTACSSESLTAPAAGNSLAAMGSKGSGKNDNSTDSTGASDKGPGKHSHYAGTWNGGAIADSDYATAPIMQRANPLSHDVTVTRSIDARGGHVSIGEAGLDVYFAPGAVATKTDITITAYAGTDIAYSFGPHGIVFNAPVIVTQDMNNITGVDGATQLYGAYVPDDRGGIAGDQANIVETSLSVITYKYDGKSNTSTPDKTYFLVQHFSGYILTGARHLVDQAF